jgi:sigma-54 specific flagellar transcriptional regulator A
MQVKFLRLLQQREYIPVGDTKTVRCDIRVVATTNRDLEAEVEAGRFREDLYYRINVVHVHLPPLRDRAEDIELLAMHFLRMVTARNGRTTPTGIDPAAVQALTEYAWPGNIRQLENVIERAVLLAPTSLVTLSDLPPRVRDPEVGAVPRAAPAPAPTPAGLGVIPSAASSVGPLLREVMHDEALADDPPSPFPPPVLPEDGLDLAAAVEAFESSLIRQALDRTGGNRNRAAQVLRINRTTLIEKIKRKLKRVGS